MEGGESLAGDASQQFPERLAQREDFSEVVGSEIWTSARCGSAFSADLNDSNHFSFGENGRTQDFLNGFCHFGSNFYVFKHRRVPCHGEIVVDFGPAIASGSSGEGRIAGQGNEPDVFQCFGHEKMEVPPARGNAHDGDFIVSYRKRLGDFFRYRREGKFRRTTVVRVQGGSNAFEFGNEACGRAHLELFSPSPRAAGIWLGRLIRLNSIFDGV